MYAKILKETETKETVVFFVTFLSLVAFKLGGAGPLGPALATPMLVSFIEILDFMIYEVRLKRNGTEVTDCATRLTISNQHFYSVA